MKGQWTDFETTVKGEGDVTIQFRANKGRFFLDDVAVTDPGITPVDAVDAAPAAPARCHNLMGMPVAPDTRGIIISNGRKIVNK